MSGWHDIQRGVAGHRKQLIGFLKHPERQQSRVLQQLLRRNCESEAGRRFGFADIKSPSEFQDRVPLQTYDDIRNDITRMMAGERKVLGTEDIVFFEETGGSTAGSKYLPVNRSSLESIRNAILPWLDDLLLARPGIMRGSAYWSISPATRGNTSTSGGIPIGMDNDAAYFGTSLAGAIESTLAVPSEIGIIGSFDAWRQTTLGHLLSRRDLSFISVWSPTFLLQLLDAVDENMGAIANFVKCVDKRRADEIQAWSESSLHNWPVLWPALDTISCWSSASSRRYADELAARFPESYLQGKGLLATEGVVTLPLYDACAPVLAVNSAFFEFIDEDSRLTPLADLRTGDCYSIVITTAGGLYRYRLGDRVLVAGHYEATPCLEYVGRSSFESDLCGEKLSEEFVRDALQEIPGFSMLVPIAGDRPSYRLLLDGGIIDLAQQSAVVKAVDRALTRNPQYRYARELGQLAPLTAERLTDPVGTYNRICLAAGRRLGDIKPTALASDWWAEAFLRTTKP